MRNFTIENDNRVTIHAAPQRRKPSLTPGALRQQRRATAVVRIWKAIQSLGAAGGHGGGAEFRPARQQDARSPAKGASRRPSGSSLDLPLEHQVLEGPSRWNPQKALRLETGSYTRGIAG
jgi:hypothetical protein